MYDTETQRKFRNCNLKDWEDALHCIFGDGIPEHKEWIGLNDINYVLKILSNKKEKILNHTIFPDGGGLDIYDSNISDYKKCLELNMGIPHICMPLKLIFDNVSNESEWCYFRLELNQMPSSNVYDDEHDKNKYYEELYEYANGFEAYNEYPTYSNSRHIARILRGCLLIIAKTSIYNNIPSTYDGRHNRVDHILFKENMTKLRNSYINEFQIDI